MYVCVLVCVYELLLLPCLEGGSTPECSLIPFALQLLCLNWQQTLKDVNTQILAEGVYTGSDDDALQVSHFCVYVLRDTPSGVTAALSCDL